MKFEKLEATGNDFVFIDQRKTSQNAVVKKNDRSKLVKEIADRHFGVGADGVVFIEEAADGSPNNIQWDFYNDDGSSAEMCGNAARCVGRWGLLRGLSSSFRLYTLSGPVEIQIKSELCFSVLIPGSGREVKALSSVDGLTGQLINTGVPHVVVETDMNNLSAVKKIVEEFRWHKNAGERGANVTLFSKKEGNSYFAKTFERGVENFTLSCGTGVLAVAVKLYKDGLTGDLQITTPGGELTVRRIAGDHLELEGSASLVFSGEWRKV